MNQKSTLRCLLLVFALVMSVSAMAHANKQACSEDLIKQNKTALADDVFMYMTPFGKPVIGKSEVKDTGSKKFEGRTNIQRSLVGEHRIVLYAAGDTRLGTWR